MHFDAQKKQLIQQEAQKTCASLGFACRTVEWLEGEKTVRLYLEKPQQTEVSVSDCAIVTRGFENAQSFDAFFPETYQLEVSSLGIEKPLVTSEHFAQAMGQEIEVELFSQEDGQKSGRGVVTEVDGSTVTLQTQRRQWRFQIDSVRFAKELANWEEVFKKGGQEE